LSLAQSTSEQAVEKQGADVGRLDNQVKLLEIRYLREIAEIRRVADEWKMRADEQLRPIEGIARQIGQLAEHRDAIVARLIGVDQSLSEVGSELNRLEATEKSDRSAIEQLAETFDGQARRWEATGASIWQLGERLTGLVEDLSQLRGGERNRREEIDALNRRIDRLDEERRRLEAGIAESNASIHAVKLRTDELMTKLEIDVAALSQRGDSRNRLAVEHLRRLVDELQQQYREVDGSAS
jgi:chromosome segregation ATPase